MEGMAHVTKIVCAMREFSHPGGEDKTAIDLNKAIETTTTITRNKWKYVAEIVTDFDPNLPPIRGFPGELNQAILNLLVNAAHAIGEVVGDGSKQKGTISLRTRYEDDGVTIRIHDTGPGIPEAIRPRIFDPFFTTKEVGKGTGQGLAIVHAVIVEKHGGTIALETEVGQGTTFILRLPLDSPSSPGGSL
jgi:signal transduction histidine kinase